MVVKSSKIGPKLVPRSQINFWSRNEKINFSTKIEPRGQNWFFGQNPKVQSKIDPGGQKLIFDQINQKFNISTNIGPNLVASTLK